MLESRDLLAADPLPVLMVLADRQDFYYREYGETRIGLEAAGMASLQISSPRANPNAGYRPGRIQIFHQKRLTFAIPCR